MAFEIDNSFYLNLFGWPENIVKYKFSVNQRVKLKQAYYSSDVMKKRSVHAVLMEPTFVIQSRAPTLGSNLKFNNYYLIIPENEVGKPPINTREHPSNIARRFVPEHETNNVAR